VGPPGLDRIPQLTHAVERARDVVRGAARVVVLTGAGVSAESGVPTFRGPGGLWKSHRPEQLATPEAFARDPRLVWEWYAWRRGLVAACAPNAAHLSLATFALARNDALLLTQNVDGLHHRAAIIAAGPTRDPTPAQPLELHGAIHRDRCSGCGRRTPGSERIDTSTVATLPRCAACGSLLRPDVVWFGEALDADVLEAAWAAAERADVCLVVGTSALVYPAAGVPDVTLARGGAVIEINPDVTQLSARAAFSLRGSAATLVPLILA
jgi:NAD-dependent deacetylase